MHPMHACSDPDRLGYAPGAVFDMDEFPFRRADDEGAGDAERSGESESEPTVGCFSPERCPVDALRAHYGARCRRGQVARRAASVRLVVMGFHVRGNAPTRVALALERSERSQRDSSRPCDEH